MKRQKVNFDFVTYETSQKIERNNAAQLSFRNIAGGDVGSIVLNGNFQLVGNSNGNFNGYTEQVNEGEFSTVEYTAQVTGGAVLLVIRKYYID